VSCLHLTTSNRHITSISSHQVNNYHITSNTMISASKNSVQQHYKKVKESKQCFSSLGVGICRWDKDHGVLWTAVADLSPCAPVLPSDLWPSQYAFAVGRLLAAGTSSFRQLVYISFIMATRAYAWQVIIFFRLFLFYERFTNGTQPNFARCSEVSQTWKWLFKIPGGGSLSVKRVAKKHYFRMVLRVTTTSRLTLGLFVQFY